MSTEEKLQRLCEAGEAMRKLQNDYWNHKIHGPAKEKKLTAAKQKEAEFDRILREVRQLQMFS